MYHWHPVLNVTRVFVVVFTIPPWWDTLTSHSSVGILLYKYSWTEWTGNFRGNFLAIESWLVSPHNTCVFVMFNASVVSAQNMSRGCVRLFPLPCRYASKQFRIHEKWQSSWSLPHCASVKIHFSTTNDLGALFLSGLCGAVWMGRCSFCDISWLSGCVQLRWLPATINGICSNALKLEHLSDVSQIVSMSGYVRLIKSNCADNQECVLMKNEGG